MVTNKKYDIQMDPRQKMSTTIGILREDLPESMEGIEMEYVLRSERRQRRLNAEFSYEKEHIFNGDVISIENS